MHAYSEDDTQSIESQTVIDDTQSANDVHSGLTFNLIWSFLAVKTSSCLSRDPRDPPQAWPIIWSSPDNHMLTLTRHKLGQLPKKARKYAVVCL